MIVEVVLPVKQGLKLKGLKCTILNLVPVEVVLPVKQGLKLIPLYCYIKGGCKLKWYFQ